MAHAEYGPLWPYTVVQEDHDGARPETATYQWLNVQNGGLGQRRISAAEVYLDIAQLSQPGGAAWKAARREYRAAILAAGARIFGAGWFKEGWDL
jgi:hypothetical protein